MAASVRSAADLPPGCHALAFYASPDEAARNMGDFVRGAFYFGQPALVVSNNHERLERYRQQLVPDTPWLAGAFAPIDGPHTRSTADGLRPLEPVMSFAAANPEGATLCGDTIPDYLSEETVEDYLRYESWFDGLRPFSHRALCPYDLARLPVEVAGATLGGLLRNHSHAVLSTDPSPAVQLLQLLVVPYLDPVDPARRGALERALARGLIRPEASGDALRLTARGELFVRALRTERLVLTAR